MTVAPGRTKVPPMVPKKKIGLHAVATKREAPPVLPKPQLSARKALDTEVAPHVSRADASHRQPRSLADFMNSLTLDATAQGNGFRESNGVGKGLVGKTKPRPPALKPKPQINIPKSRPASVSKPALKSDVGPAMVPAAVPVSFRIPKSLPQSIHQYSNKNGQVMIALPGLVNKHATELATRVQSTAVPQTRRATTSALTSTASLNQTPQKLRHLNKGRTRGPKKKSGKSVSGAKEPVTKDASIKNVTAKKKPPVPPKKPLSLAAK